MSLALTYAFIFILAMFLGLELIRRVPAQLHTPLMSGSNAISGISIIGAMSLAVVGDGGMLTTILASAAVGFAAVNVVGGYLVTDRMLAMFQAGKKRDAKKGGA
ncbi:MAG: NAD(P) transhydrogenase subunit alpha [Phycisphaeraceae bacterium]|nr:MAG: NAD(P) transhydrogenase subunit alpha [Phycisphaeraceae bacterium]